MEMIKFDASHVKDFIRPHELDQIKAQAETARKTLVEGTGAGNDFLGWIDLPVNYDKEEYGRIKAAAEKIRRDSDVLVVIGIGGSYLGARAAIEFLKPNFYNQLPRTAVDAPEIYFAGNNISGAYLNDLVALIGDRDFSVNIISKSGTTTEPSIAFRVFKAKLEAKYGKAEAAKRIYATTDKARGALKTEANAEGYESFVIPDNIGGRFSVLTAVGLLPIAVSGADLDALMAGAETMRAEIKTAPFEKNPAMQYAAIRNIFLNKGRKIEILANYEPALHNLSEWWKQLYGESEGKDGKGLYPASYDLSMDLHSLGQFVQDGSNLAFETVLNVEQPMSDVTIEADEQNLDGLNFLAGKNMDEVNKNAMMGTVLAHTDGKTPNLMIDIPARDENSLGQLFYFFEFAVGVSGYLLGVNPFNQPGVEAYKKNMFALLGKPGYEDQAEVLKKRLSE
ncbi:MAG: glucose-6-phosphate isomerase [Pseudoramibacter sp.]|jgi:glucose-6-phosphate isomerase|nr:glucose-6-phosphate isomerase [Pseudoramibacter sp.]MCH4071541.1 glucose-6-phosphate isomerase [Pseudoramibacter sp.]MCH4105309.1 glucose-6-phosphate isomerase [Pseudoramibacter sp.]